MIINKSYKKYISMLETIADDYYDRLSHITDKSYVIDKLPLNFCWIGFIIKMFPHAKIIHTIRNPIAVSYSLYKTLFAHCKHSSISFLFLNMFHEIHKKNTM